MSGAISPQSADLPFGERFLSFPDLFPARFAGSCWGEESLTLQFLGGPYQILGLAREQVEALRERFGDLCITDASDAPTEVIELTVFRAPCDDFCEVDTVGWEYSLDLRYAPGRVDLAGLSLMGSLRWRPELEGALWSPEAHGEAFCGGLENVFRAVVAYRLAALGGALLHSAGVLDRHGRAHLFLGRSGAGKTTLSRLSDAIGRQVLSDDLNAVVWESQGPVVYQMPFAGDFGQAHRVAGAFPLAGIHRLKKGTTDSLEVASPSEALGILAACATAVGRDPYRSEQLIENLGRLTEATEITTLTFQRDGAPWEVLET